VFFFFWGGGVGVKCWDSSLVVNIFFVFQVFEYLEQSAACCQTRESIKEFVEKCKKYNLSKAEILNIINIRPSSAVEIDPVNLIGCHAIIF